MLDDHHQGLVLTDDDAGRDDLEILLHHVAAAASAGFELADVTEVIEKRAPWLPHSEATALAKKITSRRRDIMGADDLGRRLGLSMEKRTALKITTIGACDVTKAQRAKLQKRKRMLRERARRATAGATPRVLSLEKTRPWEAEGISRRTWFRRQKQAVDTVGTVSCPAISLSQREIISTAHEVVPHTDTETADWAEEVCHGGAREGATRNPDHRPRGDEETPARVDRGDAFDLLVVVDADDGFGEFDDRIVVKAKAAKNRQLEIDAVKVRRVAIRVMGQFWEAQKATHGKAKPGPRAKDRVAALPDLPSLRELGIDKATADLMRSYQRMSEARP